jgi:hypothetical protein
MKPPKLPRKIVAVMWRDAQTGPDGWIPIGEVRTYGLSTCVTAGFLVRQDRKRLIIAQSLSENGRLNGTIMIPARSVVKVKVLHRARWK